MRRHPARPTLHGFTLIEVILAVTIFGLTMLAIATVMRTGIRSWNVGHNLSETLQGVRVSQGVVMRDLENVYYRKETEYNYTFRRQIQSIAQRLQAGLDPDQPWDPRDLQKFLPLSGSRRREDSDQLLLDELTPPIDLSLSGQDGGDLDRLTFVRRQRARWGDDDTGMGIHRITYYVQDGTLYREQGDVYGLQPDESLQNEINRFTPMGELSRFFVAEEPPDLGDEDWHEQPAEFERGEFLPDPTEYREPICKGVELFNITYGYFDQGEWVEVDDWNSRARKYRDPPIEEEMIGTLGEPQTSGGAYRRPETGFDSPGFREAMEAMRDRNRRPDDLPGYIAVQVGVRPDETAGRLYTFTLFYSMPQAEEIDSSLEEEEMAGMSDINRERLTRRERRRRELNERYDRTGRR